MYHIYTNCINSTQLLAKKIYTRINDDIIIVSAKTQTAGKGRRDRKWLSRNGGFYMTVVYKNLKIQQPVSLLVSYAVNKFLEEKYSVSTQIKWPNDLLYENKKICGILVDSVITTDIDIFFIGIGINYNNVFAGKKIDENEPVSIFEILGKHIDFEICFEARRLAEYILQTFQEKDWLEKYKKRCMLLDKNVSIIAEQKKIEGRITDIKETGALIIDNNIEIINAEKIIMKINYF